MKNEIFDLIVIGGGPGGYSCAILAAKKGGKVLLFENENLGGTCLNVGCIPTKYLLDKAGIMEKIRTLTDKKIFRDAGVFSFKKIQEGKLEVVKKMVGGVEYLLKANKVTVVKGFAELVDASTVVCQGTSYKAKNVIIATGSEPISVPIPGVEYTINSTEALDLKKVPGSLVVIGGGVIGMELASAYCSYGSQVTVLEMADSLFPGEEKAAIKQMSTMLSSKGIKIFTSAKVKQIEKSGDKYKVIYAKDGVDYPVEAEKVLLATGRKARLTGIDAGKLGIQLNSKGEIVTDSHMKTSVKNVYAIGDVAGGYQLAHAAYAEGEVAVDNIFGGNSEYSSKAMPRCIYTIPPFAAVGISSSKAEDEGIAYTTGSFSYTANGMAVAENATGNVYVLIDKNNKKTLGIQIVGENAPELISFATVAVEQELTLEQWEKLIVAHPSLSEMIREAALDCFGDSVHKC